ncbi:glycosyltransferase [Salidesulfovibrio brasiliensis]|uniref:glycosyltransferase n=1 Tax=Salidesulfovibrio brasiliensis TaxID=221711 RepID=UPI0006D1996E|nr:glycosyltransferase [Salidesulfovibrio brasiliensis]
MNIAFVNSTHKWGGVKTWVLGFAEQLALRGHSVAVWGRQPAFVEKARERVGHGESVSFGPDFNPVAVLRFMWEFRSRRVQVVIINVGKDLTTAGVAAKLLGIPVVQRIGLPRDIPYTKKVDRLHNWIKPVFLCPCEYIRDGFVKSLPYVTREQTKVVLSGKTCSSHPLGLNRPLRFVCSSQLNHDKGHKDVLNAMAELEGRFECRILGTGKIEQELKDLSANLGLNDRVEWTGFTTDVPGHLRECDVFLLPSYSEGLPNTLLEAMAEGLIPVARDVGGVREVWPDELAEFLLHPKAGAEEFRAALEKLLNLPDEQILALKEHARSACRNRFELQGRAEELEQWLALIA